jgi:tetratricopeptide (TPR) repeat protein
MVDEDLPAEEPAPRPQAEPVPSMPPAYDERPHPTTPPPPPPAPERKEGPAPSARPLDLVHSRYTDILDAWQRRRDALREQDLGKARAAEDRILELRQELGIESLEDLAAAEVRASARAREERQPAEALARAQLAVSLSPNLAAAYLARARAQLAGDPWKQLGPAVKDAGEAASAVWRDPRARRAFLGDVLVAALAAVFVTGALVVALLFLRRLRIVLHDARHLPVLRWAAPFQAGFLALVLLGLPLFLRLGPAAILAVLALASAPYLARSERAVLTAALVALAAVPWGAQYAATLTSWTGTLAEDVYVLEQGSDDGRIASKLEVRAGRGELPPAALVALGRHYKRRGDLARASKWYGAAGSSRPDVTVNAGNVRFLQGDLDAAKAAYLTAIDRASAAGDVAALAAAHYDLSKLFVRTSALDQAQEARKKAIAEDPSLVERYSADENFQANRYLVDVPLPSDEVTALAVDEVPAAVGDAVKARLSGALPTSWGPGLLVCVAFLLWIVALARRRLAPSTACDRCGHAACARCGPASDVLCGQCVNVFTKRGVVDARDKLRKQLQVKRHARARRVVARTLAVVSGGAGHLWRGDALFGALALLALTFLAWTAVFWHGALPQAHPTGWDVAAKLGLAVPLALVVWWLAVRDLFRRTRG